jgi:hypothetical protein
MCGDTACPSCGVDQGTFPEVEPEVVGWVAHARVTPTSLSQTLCSHEYTSPAFFWRYAPDRREIAVWATKEDAIWAGRNGPYIGASKIFANRAVKR